MKLWAWDFLHVVYFFFSINKIDIPYEKYWAAMV